MVNAFGTPAQFDYYAEMTVNPYPQWGDNFPKRIALIGKFEEDDCTLNMQSLECLAYAEF